MLKGKLSVIVTNSNGGMMFFDLKQDDDTVRYFVKALILASEKKDVKKLLKQIKDWKG